MLESAPSRTKKLDVDRRTELSGTYDAKILLKFKHNEKDDR